MKYIYNLIDIEGLPAERVGHKALNLSTLMNKDLDLVPPAFVVDSEVIENYLHTGGEYPKGFEKEIDKGIKLIEKKSKSILGDPENPLLVSLRISENNSSDGVKNKIINIGLNDTTAEGLIKIYGRHKFAYSAYCQFVYDFASLVLGIDRKSLDKQTDAIMSSEKIADYTFLEDKHLKQLVALYKAVVFNESGQKFPEDPIDQLKFAMDSIYDSWESKRARTYRKARNYEDKGCALIVQQMVFGNLGVNSGVGKIESRNSRNGEKGIFGQFLHESQGPELDESKKDLLDISVVEERFSECYERLMEIASGLEIVNKNAVELDFTIEDGKLWILEIARPALSAKASVSVAADMLRNEIISPEEALCGLEGERLDQVFYPQIDERSNKITAFSAKFGSVGVAQGVLYFDIKRGIEALGENKILVIESSTDIISNQELDHFDGYICLRGSANGRLNKYSKLNGKPCIINCPTIQVDWNGRKLVSQSGVELQEGSVITIDADSKNAVIGDVFLLNPDIDANLKYIISNADQASRIETCLLTDEIKDIEVGKSVGLNKIGLFDITSIFYNDEERSLFLDLILNINASRYVDSYSEIVKILKNKFIRILQETGDNEINFALFGDSLNAILPSIYEVGLMADKLNISEHDLNAYIDGFKDDNPEFGLAGAKIYSKYSKIFDIQLRAIVEAVIDVRKQNYSCGSLVSVVVPGVNRLEESNYLLNKFKTVLSEYKDKLDVEIGFKAEVTNMVFLYKIDDLSIVFDEIIVNLDKLTASAYGISLSDGVNVYDKTYDFNPFDRFDFESLGDTVASKIRRFKEIAKSPVSVMGNQVVNKSTVDYLERAGFDKLFCTKNNSLRCKVLCAQAALMRY